MSPFVRWRGVLLRLVGPGILGVVLWRAGADPFLAGLRALDPTTIVLGVLLAVPTTLAGAWRWRIVAGQLGVGIGLAPAVASCYRAQFLNTTLPAGVLGDVHRGVRHGRHAGDTGRALRAVAWERLAGQVVQGVVAVTVLLLVPSPARPVALVGLAVVAGGLASAFGVDRLLRSRPGSRAAWALGAARRDLRRALLARRAWPGVVLASAVALAGHVTTYLLAARAVGIAESPARMLPLVLVVLVAAGIPLNLAGWGPREGVAAWSFGAGGLGVDQGVATAVAYGAMVLVATLPGAVVLALAAAGRAHGRAAGRSDG